jgi:KDO2-lipid IV(A) lauroyltransferase
MNLRAFLLRLRLRCAMTYKTIVGVLAVGVIRLVRRFDIDRSINLAARLTRRIGPWLSEHRIGRDNLSAAFPEKSPAEIETILREVWANLGRVGAEFAHLDRLWDFDESNPTQRGRIEISPTDNERATRLRGVNKVSLAFTAHYANWELTAVACAARGVRCAVLYRTPNIARVGRYVREIRASCMGMLIPTTLDAPARIANLLQQGTSVGMLVDQHYTRGVDVTFFGRRCKANPLIARLARQLECPIYGLRMVRLPGNRFRSEITEAIEPMRDAEGKIDVAGTMQVITSIVEGWVREHPEQWLWLHRRWR